VVWEGQPKLRLLAQISEIGSMLARRGCSRDINGADESEEGNKEEYSFARMKKRILRYKGVSVVFSLFLHFSLPVHQFVLICWLVLS